MNSNQLKSVTAQIQTMGVVRSKNTAFFIQNGHCRFNRMMRVSAASYTFLLAPVVKEDEQTLHGAATARTESLCLSASTPTDAVLSNAYLRVLQTNRLYHHHNSKVWQW